MNVKLEFKNIIMSKERVDKRQEQQANLKLIKKFLNYMQSMDEAGIKLAKKLVLKVLTR